MRRYFLVYPLLLIFILVSAFVLSAEIANRSPYMGESEVIEWNVSSPKAYEETQSNVYCEAIASIPNGETVIQNHNTPDPDECVISLANTSEGEHNSSLWTITSRRLEEELSGAQHYEFRRDNTYDLVPMDSMGHIENTALGVKMIC